MEFENSTKPRYLSPSQLPADIDTQTQSEPTQLHKSEPLLYLGILTTPQYKTHLTHALCPSIQMQLIENGE